MEHRETLKRLIKHRHTGRYYAENAHWTRDPNEAKVFHHLSVAMHVACSDGLKDNCVVVYRIGQKDLDVIN